MRWSEFLGRITLRSSFPLRVKAIETLQGTKLRAMLDVPDIHTGKMQTVHVEWPAFDNLNDENAFRFVRMLLREILEHELDECLLLDGVQVNDPHANTLPTPPTS